ncbi:hypothetical protein GGE68_002905 [Rhizobium leguminosarum]|uniref:hypothetical protein n=1 Tax=Rhizobium leguminosarum TaxID=384 RepID=UPI00161DE5CE|nr:hypothetical protein [Rhizobium leguminosarum]MBB5664708.1 hypothetical protein [Rhizobium leguminosarum]
MSSMIERVARAMCVSRGVNPECLHQFNVFSGEEQFDHEDNRGKRYRLGWRSQEAHARAAIEAVISAAMDSIRNPPHPYFWPDNPTASDLIQRLEILFKEEA